MSPTVLHATVGVELVDEGADRLDVALARGQMQSGPLIVVPAVDLEARADERTQALDIAPCRSIAQIGVGVRGGGVRGGGVCTFAGRACRIAHRTLRGEKLRDGIMVPAFSIVQWGASPSVNDGDVSAELLDEHCDDVQQTLARCQMQGRAPIVFADIRGGAKLADEIAQGVDVARGSRFAQLGGQLSGGGGGGFCADAKHICEPFRDRFVLIA